MKHPPLSWPPQKASNAAEPLAWAHPIVRQWFIDKFGEASEPQRQGWPSLLAQQATLISAPTGSGKTLAAFLTCIDQLFRQALKGELSDMTQVVYVSPLKALSNDIHKNLTAPLQEIINLAHSQGLTNIHDIRVAVRTGDTPASDRQKMLKRPPHILVTTPESLYILLTAEKSRIFLTEVKTVIVDEIHALANSKRGSHLSLSLERLNAICAQPPVRVGLSATQKPIERVGKFLVGHWRPEPYIVQIGYQRSLDLAIEVPGLELGPVASYEMWDEMYEKIANLAQNHRSTLIFVNTRKLAERVAHHLSQLLGEGTVAAHHGSLSRKIRLAAENKLKQGELKALVATASLELGIDIGSIDLVCQIGSPRAIAAALQRIGRAGHYKDAISKGRFFVTTRDELVECAALVHAIHAGHLDQLIIPHQPLDILSQQIVAICATDDWHEQALFDLIRQAYPYSELPYETYDAILNMLAEGISGTRGRHGVYLFRDRVNHVVKARRAARLTAIMNGGAIPEAGLFTVIAEPHETMVGTLDEEFAVESSRGDIILLGTTSWQIQRIEPTTGKVRVADAHGAPPTVPFWQGEAPGRTEELSAEVAHLREKIAAADNPSSISKWLQKHCGLDRMGAEQLIEYIFQGKAMLGAVPTQTTIIAERFFDESGGMQLVLHTPFGARINKAWGLALRKCFCRSFNFELQASATDDGLNIALAEQHSFPLSDVFQFVHPNTLKKTLTQAVLQSPLFNTRFRWAATRSLTLPRFRFAKKIPPNILRMLADDLLAAVFPDAAACQDNLAGKYIELPDHPLIEETMKDALTEAMDIEGLSHILTRMNNGEIRCLAVDTTQPSVFAHEILNANPYAYLDDAPFEERRARAVEMRRVLPDTVTSELGQLDPEAIAEVKRQAWPDIRSADELHDTLQTLIVLPEQSAWQTELAELSNTQRVGVATLATKTVWYAAERAHAVKVIYGEALTEIVEPALIEHHALEQAEAIVQMVRGWMQHLGPTTADYLQQMLGIRSRDIETALLRLESTGLILRGHFTNKTSESVEWCERRLLARIHRYTIGRLRQEIAPVTAAQFMEWLLQWQHLAPGSQLKGEQGLVEALKQLQGFEIPANAWERYILPKRVIDYSKSMLDKLCLTGAIGWGRLPPTTTSTAEVKDSKKPKRIMPTSIAPITFFCA